MQQQPKTRVLLVDDHAMMRDGTKLLLSQDSNIEIVGEAKDGNEGLEMTRDLDPDLVIFDITMPGLNGVELAKQLTDQKSHARLLVLTAHQDATYLRTMLKIGVSGFISKSASGRELLEAVHNVMKGYLVVPHDTMDDFAFNSKTIEGKLEKLSDREVEVLRLLITNQRNAQIADSLNISPKTLETHVRNIYNKLGIDSRASLLLNSEKWSIIISELS
jgi:DNA-binding NarL/FixJ family response regulator